MTAWFWLLSPVVNDTSWNHLIIWFITVGGVIWLKTGVAKRYWMTRSEVYEEVAWIKYVLLDAPLILVSTFAVCTVELIVKLGSVLVNVCGSYYHTNEIIFLKCFGIKRCSYVSRSALLCLCSLVASFRLIKHSKLNAISSTFILQPRTCTQFLYSHESISSWLIMLLTWQLFNFACLSTKQCLCFSFFLLWSITDS